MNKTKVVIISLFIILLGNILINAYQYTINIDQYKELQYTIGYARNTELERDALKDNINVLAEQRDEAKTEQESLTTDINILSADVVRLEEERDQLKHFVDVISNERDTTRFDVDVLEGRINQAYADLEAKKTEVQELKEEIVEVNYRLNELEYKQSYAIDRVIHISLPDGESITDTGTSIIIRGSIVNTGLNDVTGIGYHILAWNLMEELCINLTININGDINTRTSLKTGQYKYVDCALDYTPYALTRYEVTVVCDDSTLME